MPFLSILTNAPLSAETESALATAASKTLATCLGKPEAYVMVSVQSKATLRFAGSDAFAAFLEIKSIGLPRDLNTLAQMLTDVVTQHAQIPARCVYVTFADVPATHWAHGGTTFA